MRMGKQSEGFTLVELLVVVAIIGILSSVVIASLNTARTKGANAGIKANLATIRAQAEILYDGDSDYDAVCGANSVAQNANVAQAIVQANTASGGTAVCGKPTSGAAGAWAVSSPLKGETATVDNWCVDSTGVAKALADPIAATAVAC